MSKYREVRRCKECGKIYSQNVPEICSKCGAELAYRSMFDLMTGLRSFTDKCEKVVARRKLLRWEIKE